MDSARTYLYPTTFAANTDRASFNISVISISLFASALIAVTFFDSSGKRVDRVLVQLTGDDYTNWQADDNYLVTYVNNYITNIYIPSLNAPPSPPILE